MSSATAASDCGKPIEELKLPRRLQMVLARLTGLIARGVPEVMWAFLFIAFFGPGLLAGTVAIAIHSAGVLVRVFSESIDNIPYRRFEQSPSAAHAPPASAWWRSPPPGATG